MALQNQPSNADFAPSVPPVSPSPKIELGNLGRELDRMQPLPASAIRLMQACRNPDGNILQLIGLIESDPGIAAQVIATANSPRYGQSRMIDSIQHAIVVLGFRTICQIATTIAAQGVFMGSGQAAEHHKRLFHHCLACGSVARLLAARDVSIDPGAAFLAGLLHDVGKLVFLSVASDPYVQATAGVPDEEIIEVEKAVFGYDHQEIGMMCGERWGLPEELLAAVGYHHSPRLAPSHDALAHLTHAANSYVIQWGLGDETLQSTGCPDEYAPRLVLSEEDQEALLAEARVEFEKLQAVG